MTAYLLAGFVALAVARTIFVLACALKDARARRRHTRAGAQPLVSIVIPAYNEEKVIEATLRAVAASDCPTLEVIVVDDGSIDTTRERVHSMAAALPALRLVELPYNQGKARALNAGVAVAAGEIVVTVDADTQVEPGAIRTLVAALEEPGVVAAAGNVKVGNRTGWLTRWQALEYVTALNLDRRAQAWLACVTTVPGALGAFRRDAIYRAGMFVADTLAEDTDLTLSLLETGARVRYADRAVAWTEAPADQSALFRQRTRWLLGNLQCAFKHKGALRHSRHPGLRWFALPNFWYTHLFVHLLFPFALLSLPALAAWLTPGTIATLVGGFFLIDLVLTTLALRLDHEDRRLLWDAPLQRLLYPLFLWAVFAGVCWRLISRRRAPWSRVERIGAVLLGQHPRRAGFRNS